MSGSLKVFKLNTFQLVLASQSTTNNWKAALKLQQSQLDHTPRALNQPA
jgi:hypothetical protein